MDRAFSLIHWGAFSGTVPMIKEPLARLADVTYHDVTDLTHRPGLIPARLIASARCIGRDGPWYKTGVWSKALESHFLSNRWIRADRPTVFFQTLAAPRLRPEHRYVIYTDRVGREGALGDAEYRSTWGPGWIEREEKFLAQASAILVMGPSTRQILIDSYGIDGSKVGVVGAGPGSEIGPIARRSGPPRRILFVGTDWRLKGGPEVVEAFSRISGRYPGMELILVGSQPDLPRLPRGARTLGRIPSESMARLFSECDLFVVPTFMEALGYSLLEALLHGLPAIGSTVGNQGWMIGKAGLTVEPGNVDSVAEAIEAVLVEYDRFKANAVDRAAELRNTMTWDRVAREIVDRTFVLGDGTGPDARPFQSPDSL